MVDKLITIFVKDQDFIYKEIMKIS